MLSIYIVACKLHIEDFRRTAFLRHRRVGVFLAIIYEYTLSIPSQRRREKKRWKCADARNCQSQHSDMWICGRTYRGKVYTHIDIKTHSEDGTTTEDDGYRMHIEFEEMFVCYRDAGGGVRGGEGVVHMLVVAIEDENPQTIEGQRA